MMCVYAMFIVSRCINDFNGLIWNTLFCFALRPSSSNHNRNPFAVFICSGLALLFFLTIWLVSFFAPLCITHWAIKRVSAIYAYLTNEGEQTKIPPLLEFFYLLNEASRSILLSLILALHNTSWEFSTDALASNCSIVSHFIVGTFQHIQKVFGLLSWRDLLPLSYITAILSINIWDAIWPRGRVKLPKFVKTHDGHNLTIVERLRLMLMRTAADWFLPGVKSAVNCSDSRCC